MGQGGPATRGARKPSIRSAIQAHERTPAYAPRVVPTEASMSLTPIESAEYERF